MTSNTMADTTNDVRSQTPGASRRTGVRTTRASPNIGKQQMSRSDRVSGTSRNIDSRQESPKPERRLSGDTRPSGDIQNHKSHIFQSRTGTASYEQSQRSGSWVTGSQMSLHFSRTGKEYDEEGYEGEDEEDDDDSYVPHCPEYVATEPITTPRVQVSDGPVMVNKNASSFLYEKITCYHSGMQKQNYPGVCRCDLNWNCCYEEPKPRKKSQTPQKNASVKGCPYPLFLVEYDDDDEEYEEREGPEDDFDYDKRDDGFFDEYDQEQGEVKVEYHPLERSNSGNLVLSPFPKIGYSPPSSARRNSFPQSLPSLPDSPYLTASRQSRESCFDSEIGSKEGSNYRVEKRLRSRRKVNKDRRFQGRTTVNPVSKKVVSHDSKPSFRKHPNEWEAEIENPPSNLQSKRSSRLLNRQPTLQTSSRNSNQGSRVVSNKYTPREDDLPEEDDEEKSE